MLTCSNIFSCYFELLVLLYGAGCLTALFIGFLAFLYNYLAGLSKKKSGNNLSKEIWSNLPTDLVETILAKAGMMEKTIATPILRKVAIPKVENSIPKNGPWLFISYDKTRPNHHAFFSLYDQKIYWLPKDNKLFVATSNGWMVSEEDNCVIDKDIIIKHLSLVNPVTNVQVHLPPLVISVLQSRCKNSLSWRKEIIVRAVLSSSVLMVMLNEPRRLAFCKAGNTTWYAAPNLFKNEPYHDIQYFQDKFYAVQHYGRVVVFDLDKKFPSAIEIKQADPNSNSNNFCEQYYLVESSGELLLVSRRRGWTWTGKHRDEYKTVSFQIYAWSHRVNGNWREVRSLSDRTLFLGVNHSFSIVASDLPGVIKANCIYFMGHNPEYAYCIKANDVGVFNLKNGHVEPLPVPGYRYDVNFVTPPPMWVTTSPW